MRLHDRGPREETPETARVFRGHDYGTRGERTPERPLFENRVSIEGVFSRLRSWLYRSLGLVLLAAGLAGCAGPQLEIILDQPLTITQRS